jgi:hypothetical protein
MMVEMFLALVVQGLQIGLDGEPRLAFEDLCPKSRFLRVSVVRR